MNRKIFSILILAGLTILSSCKVGPAYKRPVTNYDSLFRFAGSSDTLSLGDLQWTTLLKDPELKAIIDTALRNNFDIGIAYSRIEQARGYFKEARGAQFPVIGAGVEGGYQKTAISGSDRTLEFHQFNAVANISYEVDLWGKLRSAKEAARAQLFRQEAYQQLVRITLINEVVATYFNLLEFDNELVILKETIGLRQKSLELVKAKMIAGTASGLVVAQAEAELALAMQEVPKVELAIGQQENYLCLLTGAQPHSIKRGLPLAEQIISPSVKTPGIPSMVIVNRPDVIMAEEALIAANANIGVARANMLPSLTLSGYAGTTISPANFIYNAVGGLIAPIFSGGRLRANLNISKAQKEEMLLTYQKTIYSALAEISNSLLGVQKSIEITDSQLATYQAAKTAYDLSNQLYDAGYASFLDVINAQELLFESQISLSQAQSSELISKVNLYTALGGGLK